MSNLIPLFPSESEFRQIKEMGQMAVKSGFLPTSINTPEKAVIIMLKGRELGIPPMQAFAGISVVNGKPGCNAELMLSLIYKNCSGAIINFLESTIEKCVLEAQRPNGKMTKWEFNLEDAKRANLLNKDSWTKYPPAMLRARAISAMARAVFPDSISNMHTPEELGAEVNEDGNVIDVENNYNKQANDEKPKTEALPPQEPKKPVNFAAPENLKPAQQPATTNPFQKASDPGDFVISFGKFKGTALKDINPIEVDNYYGYIIGKIKETGKPAQGSVQEFIDVAGLWLAQQVDTPLDPFPDDERFPQ